MSLNKSGAVLEGIRLAVTNNQFGYPPRNFVTDKVLFNNQTSRSEYLIVAGSINDNLYGADIAHPDLLFSWVKNDGSILRFDFNGFLKTWAPMPGSSPNNLGVIEEGKTLIAPIPDINSLESPISLFVGIEERLTTFDIIYVSTEADFSQNLQKNSVELALDTGSLNFSDVDIINFSGQSLYSQRQKFFDRQKFTGSIGKLPFSIGGDQSLYLNPLPSTGYIPRIRINYGKYLNPIEVIDDSYLESVNQGQVLWSRKTGKIKISNDDINENLGKEVYYDGVFNNNFQLNSQDLINFSSNVLIGVTDTTRYVIYAELNNVRSYFPYTIVSSQPKTNPRVGFCCVNSVNGEVYLNSVDKNTFQTWNFKILDTVVEVENGVSVQFFRSAVNTTGIPTVDDFSIKYKVQNQVINDRLNSSPFIQLSTIPICNNSLSYRVEQGQFDGTFVGELKDSTKPGNLGIGYTLNLDKNQFQFSNRKITEIITVKESPYLKIEDALISEYGLEIKKNGVKITPDNNFTFDNVTGQLLFLESVGSTDPSNINDINGCVSAPNLFTSSTHNFSNDDIGSKLLISTGQNVGIYNIDRLGYDSKNVYVSPDFNMNEILSVDLKKTSEVLVDNFWSKVNQKILKLSVYKSSSNGSSKKLDENEFTFFTTTGQINFIQKTEPDDIFKIDYEYISESGDLVKASEYASFKIRQEQAITTSGSNSVKFNLNEKTIDINKNITVYINGVTQKTSSVEYEAPGTLKLKTTITDQIVFVSYYVREASGGETNIQTLNGQLSVDSINISQGQTSLVLNGDFTSSITANTALLFNNINEVLLTKSSSYDQLKDKTTLTFSKPSSFSSTNELMFSSTSPIKFIEESSSINIISKNEVNVNINGNVLSSYKQGTILTIDDDPFMVVSSYYNTSINKTIFTLNVKTKNNYISPVIKFSSGAVSKPTFKLQTAKLANINKDLVLIRMGNNRKIMTRGTDYEIEYGGLITLTDEVSSGSYEILYTADDFIPIGTKFNISYSHIISPNSMNGIQGQKLTSSYDLASPDSFFYRIETVETFLPEVKDYIKQKSQIVNVYGPNTKSITSRSNKDEGSPSLYFNEQHYSNIDFTIIQILKIYNDLINYYEDILSNIDGRLVGGEHGKFRFDGKTDNPPRSSYASITNDIDDKVKLYDKMVLTGFYTFSPEPVYAYMHEPNSLSRLFPTNNSISTAINNQTGQSNNGKVLGTIGTTDLISVDNFSSTPSSSYINYTSYDETNTTLFIYQNGSEEDLIPKFETGQVVTIYTNSGIKVIDANVVSVNNSSIEIDEKVTASSGSVSRNVAGDTTSSRYATGIDIGIKLETGEIKNITVDFPGNTQTEINGNEILNTKTSFINKDTTPKRIPVLDGSVKNDYGFISVPRLRREGEKVLFEKEQDGYRRYDKVKTTSGSTDIESNIKADVGDIIRLLNGPDAFVDREIVGYLSSGNLVFYTVDTAFTSSGTYDGEVVDPNNVIQSSLSRELGVLMDNSPQSGTVPKINSETKLCDNIIRTIGIELSSGFGRIISNNQFFSSSTNFILDGVTNESYLYITNNSNLGLYKIGGVSNNIITIISDDIWNQFSVHPEDCSYYIFNLETFVTHYEPEFLTVFLRESIEFYNLTYAYSSSFSSYNIGIRIQDILKRITRLDYFVEQVTNILTNTDSLYEMRYIWIQERTDKKNGILTQVTQSMKMREENQKNLISNQKKLLMLQG